MNKERIRLWVDALRSGEYKQTVGRLCERISKDNDEFAYCCLGVACEVAGVAKENTISEATKAYCGFTGPLPKVVADWYGIPCEYNSVLPQINNKCLTELNDNGATFEEIAQLIEDNWLREGSDGI